MLFTGPRYEQTCHIFDDLWNKDHLTYEIPHGSFCSNTCINKNPTWVECKEETMPTIHYYSAQGKMCDIVTKRGIDNTNNADCMDRLGRFLKNIRPRASAKVVYIVHGFTNDGSTWELQLKDSFLKKYRSNTTIVGVVSWKDAARMGRVRAKESEINLEDFSKLSIQAVDLICCVGGNDYLGINYPGASINTWAVGNILAYVNYEISHKHSLRGIKTFCVGHSLGSHLCGFFGKMANKLEVNGKGLHKIIAMDPAGPIFQFLHQDPSLRLHKDDAKRVEIFHTNTNILGFVDPIGNIDYYINGGGTQPCRWFPCSHAFAYKLLININNNNINNKQFPCNAEYKCDVEDGSQLSNIRREEPGSNNFWMLIHRRVCERNVHNRPSLGTLIGDERIQGTYWLEVGNRSSTCQIDTSSKHYNECVIFIS